MKKNISINLQGIIFHIEEDGYEVLSRYLQEVKAYFATYQGHEEIVADIEGRIAELFSARLSVNKQVITLADVAEMQAKMGRVSDFQAGPEEEDEPAAQTAAPGSGAGPTPPPSSAPRTLYRDLAHRKIAGVCAGLAQYFQVNPLWIRLSFLALVLLPGLFRSVFRVFDGDFISWHRPDLGGLAVITYLILWIVLPKRLDAPTPIDTIASTGPLAGRKLFRDTDAGKVGGVAAGLAAYFSTDVVLVRVLLLIGLFLGGSTFIIYLIFWIVVPEARTVSEKMQMRGDAVTLSGIDQSVRATAADLDAPAGPNRPVGTFLESAAREARPAVNFIGTLIRWFVAALLLATAGSMLVAFTMALGAMLGWLPGNTVQLGDEQSTYFLLHDVPAWAAVSGFLVLIVPTLAFFLLGLRLLLRRPVLGRTASLSLLGLFLLALGGTLAATARVVGQFREQGTYTNLRRLAPVPGRGVVLAARELEDKYRWVRLRVVAADSGAAPFVEEEYRANGPTRAAARLTAQTTMLYNVTQQDSTLTFDEGMTLREQAPFRNQRLNLTLHLPLDKTYRLTPAFRDHLGDNDFVDGRRPNDDERDFRARLTRDGQFRCLDCPASSAGSTRDDSDDSGDGLSLDANGNRVRINDEGISLDVNGNRLKLRADPDGNGLSLQTEPFSPDPARYGTGRKTLTNPGTFEEVEAHGAVRLLLRTGEQYRVEAAGRPRDLDRLRLRVSGDRLLVEPTREEGLLSELSSSHRPILVTITLPRLRFLDLSGACQADARGFRGEALHGEASGASAIRFTDLQVPHLEVNLSGASRASAQGRADELRVECNGTSRLDALSLQAQRATLDLSGVSQANVRVSKELRADLSGNSRARYAGRPTRLKKDLSGNSALEEASE